MLCTVLLIGSSDSLWSQVIHNTGGAVMSVSSGTVITADTITNDGISSINNEGTINVTVLINNGAMTGNGVYNVVGTFTNTGTFTPGTSEFDFSSSSPQTIPAINYYNLTVSGTGARTLANSGTIGISGVFTPGTNSYTITGSTIDFNGSGAQTIPAFNYNNLTSSSTGTRTLDNSGTIGIAGTFTPGTNSYTITGSTIDFNGSGGQTIPTFNFNNVTSSSTGARTLVNGGTIGIAGTFTPGSNAYTITNNTIDFNGSGAQTIPVFNGVTGYNNVIISNSGTKSSPSGTTTTVIGGNLTLSSGLTYEQASGATATLTLNGTSNTISGELGSVANPFTTINLGNGNGDATSITATTGSLNSGTVAIGAFTITVTNNNTANISGNLTGGAAGATWVNAANSSLSVGGTLLTTGTLTATANPNTVTYNSTTAAQTIKGTTYHDLIIDKEGQVGTIGAATIVNGDVTVNNGTLALAAFAFTVSGTANINDSLRVTSATGTKSFVDLNLNTNAILTASAAATFNVSGNLTMDNSSSITGSATNVISVTGNLNIPGTSVTIGNSTITVTDTTLISGDVNFNSATGTKTFVGPVVISSGASWSSSSNSAFTLRNGLIHNGTSFSSGTGVYTFNTNAQTLNGTSQLTFANLTATGITLTDSNSHASGLTITTALAGTGGLTMPANGLLTLGGTSTITTLTVTANPNTVVYNGTTAAQTIKGTTYHDLIIDKSGQVGTIGAATIVNGDVTVNNGTLALAGFAFTVSGSTNVNDSLSVTSATGAKSLVDLNLNANSTLLFSATATLGITGNLAMGNSSIITGSNTGVINVTNNLNITGTSVVIGRSTITVTDSTLVTGDVNFNNATGTKTFVGPVVISGTGSWSSSANSAFTLRGGIQNDNTFNSGTGTYTFNTNSQTLSGSGGTTFSGPVAITGAITIDVTTTNSFGGSITGSVAGSTVRPATGLTLNFLGAAVLATGTLDLTTNTPNSVVYGSTGVAQTVKGTTYYNLEINGNNNVKTLGANTTVNNQLTVTAGTFNLSTFNLIMGASAPIVLNDSLLVTSATGTRTWNNLTLNASGTFSCSAAETFSLLGDWTNNGGTFTPGTSTVSFDGTAAQSVNGTAASQTFFNFTVNNSTGSVSTGGSTTDLNIDGAFTLTLGTFTAPATMSVAGNWSEATGTTFTAGSGTITFDGASAQVLGTTATKTFNNVVINKTAGQTLSTGGSTTTITINGTLTQTLGNFTPPATLNVTGNTTLTTGTFSIGAGTKTLSQDLNINSTAIMSCSNAAAIINVGGDLNLSGTGSITGTATGTITITGNLNSSGTGNTIGRSTINVTDSTIVTGTLDFNSATGTKTFIGPIVLFRSGAWSSSSNSAFILRGGLTHNGTSFSSGTGTYTFNTNNQDINSSSSIVFSGAVGITGAITVTNKTNLTITGALTGSVAGSTLANDVNDTLSFEGAVLATGTLTATANPNLVRYTSTTAAQTIKGTTYHHLQVATSGIKTIGANTTVNGDVTVANGTLALAGFTFTASGTTTINDTLSVTSATGTKSFVDLNLNTNAILTASAAATFNVSGNLTMGNSSSITGGATNVISVTGNLNIPGTSVTIGNSTITVTDTTLITGDVNFNSATGTKTFVGPVVINSGASWSSSSNSAFTLRGGLTHNGTTFSSGTGSYTFNTNNQDINGSSSITFDGIVAISGAITVTNYSTVTLTTNLTGSVGGSTWFNEANSTLNVGAALLTTGTLNASGNPNTVNYTGGVQTVKGGTYHHLLLSVAGAKTASAAITVNGNLTLSSTASLNDAGFQIVGNASGTFSVSSGSTLTLGSVATATLFPTNFVNANITLDAASAVVYNSDQAQTISVVPTYGNLTLTSIGAVIKTINGAATVATDLTVGTNNTLSITGAGSVQINTGNLILNGSLDNNGTIDIGL